MAKTHTERDLEAAEIIIGKELKWHYKNFKKKTKIPFSSYDKGIERKYRKRMIKALALVLDYYGVEVETEQRKAKRTNPTTVGGKADSATLP